ncbi:MupA/Atu3671 family FMN-dependent luciferase-like monooxygenase [Cognatishimia sp. F0-27]|uniref:MupA/Atu3671 family FMN-dependent luciferase-like monooxygenase n=1 Tax=Cognatishimia sp. F0-27 TaxID=2816855 RepID=UPI001D0C84CB|nr:MupA/Atu3671 family FMN-dependent luciferase-like monooxygenase [Cognatishimia sp. F0-27]MCC1491155.1 LLM class flavin-dependent oxidoreductase [Cognatishimia sp. F0-27]
MALFSCVAIGNESLLVQCCEAALARGNRLDAVVTHNADIADWAQARGIRVEQPGADLAARLSDLTFDWLLSIANLTIIREDVLALPARGAINFHDGPLPRHAGLNAPIWAMIEGETTHGISWHLIEGGVDEGDILVTQAFDITENDTALTLNAKAYSAAIDSFDRLLDQLESGVLSRTKQDLSDRSYHARTDRPSGHGMLDFRQPADALARLVRALDHGPYWNPLAIAKFRSGGRVFLVGQAEQVSGDAAPGTILGVDGDSLTVACGDGALRLSALRASDGTALDPADLGGVEASLDVTDDAEIETVTRQKAAIAAHIGFWRKRLKQVHPAQLAIAAPGRSMGALQTVPVPRPVSVGEAAVWALDLIGADGGDLCWRDRALADLSQSGCITPWVPIAVEPVQMLSDMQAMLEERTGEAAARKGFAIDLPFRDPELAGLTQPELGVSDGAGPVPGCALTLEVGAEPVLHFDSARISDAMARALVARLEAIVAAARPNAALADLPRMGAQERHDVLEKWNDTALDVDKSLTMHAAFEAQVDRTPDASALVFEDARLSYAELDAKANAVAHVLRETGVGPGMVVGLCCSRSFDLVAGALGILKAGGAYLPMDPAYPADRLEHFVKDSKATVILTHGAARSSVPETTADTILIDSDPRIVAAPRERLDHTASPEDLAYLIYTSGSTGKPKGVMVEHRNAINFFAGMDAHIPHQAGDTWLAVTSLSFDISVLELFWTTARGFTVVLASDEDRAMISNGPLPKGGTGMAFSIYYWGNDDGVGRDKYRLLLEGAKFADDNGFVAVWTPERHFHAFGGPYPNPSVTGAAVAGVTRNIGVRGGSVVAPLHHPARIAEEWAVIDNLTNGRAGMAIASGWQPDDFVLRPENTPPANKPAMIEAITTVRKLWRGEPVAFPKQDGSLHEVITQPRPVSKDLPVWVTTAGNPETWKEAGRLGCNVLTHLLGQSIDEVAEKITLYHAALREAGHDPQDFDVTLMLHTCLADTREQAREIAREPMKDYLRSAAGLIKQYAWAFPAFKRPKGVSTPFELDLGSLTEDELDGILDFAFERYFNDSGLFGTIEDAEARTADLHAIGVTEIACLIDYGIAADQVLEGLKPLAQVVASSAGPVALEPDDFSIAAQILRHEVTHLQCTPSMARMFAMNDEAREALRRVKHLYLGGEPLPGALVAEYATITNATVTNMYGPTETTIWSSVAAATAGAGTVDLGLPIANTQLYVLDAAGAPVPLGVEGELWIGGDGVTRGYWNRSELTGERFRENPFHGGRMYGTGDLVRRREDGRIDFVGRVDHQVKLRGFRIELGEIEAALEAQPSVGQAVVLAREDAPGDVRLVGYVTGSGIDEGALKASLSEQLPSFMVPVRIVQLEALPLTPNKKVDRKALPVPDAMRAPIPPRVSGAPPTSAAEADKTNPATTAPQPRHADQNPEAESIDIAAIEVDIAAIWSEILGRDGISAQDSFFDLGGHSLLAVQAHRAIRERMGAKTLSITDIFRFPVLTDLATQIAAKVTKRAAPVATADSARAPVPAPAREPVAPTPAVAAPTPATGGVTVVESAPILSNERAKARSDAMARRREMRARRRA